MNVIVCIDNHYGMMYNNRRQSRDEIVIGKIKEIVGSKKLYANEYSSRIFDGFCTIVHEPLQLDDNAYCFVENIDILPYLSKIQHLYIFKWNRDYPYDFVLNTSYREKFHLVSREDFKGKSHDNITLEVWGR